MSAKESSGNNKTLVVVGAVVGAVVLLLLVAVVFSGGGQLGGSEYGEPTLEGTALPPMPSNVHQDTSANGLPAPSLSGVDFNGDPVSFTNDGRAKGIVFLAHWCGNCQEEVPRVQAWLDAGGSVEGVDLYSVTTAVNSARPNYPPSEWLEREGWTVPIIRDDKEGSAHRAFGAGGFPYWVFVNSDGTVALRVAGQTDIPELVDILESLK